jgi:multiple sugar transport system substrate-binding protein
MKAPLHIAIRRFADFEDSMREQVQAFVAATGEPEPTFAAFDLHGLHNALFAQGGLADGTFDLALFSTDWIAEARAAGVLEELSPHLLHTPHVYPGAHPGAHPGAQTGHTLDWGPDRPVDWPVDWPEGWPASLTRPCIHHGLTDTIPWHDGPEALLYRADRFADPAEQAAYLARFGEPLAPPRTWNQFLQIARFFTRPDQNQWGTLVAAYPDGHNTLYDLTLLLWSHGGDWAANAASNATGNAAGESTAKPNGGPGSPARPVTLDTPAMAAALTFYRTLVTDPALCHPRSPRLASTETGDVFTGGEAVMMVNWFGFAARSERADSPIRGRVALAPIPRVSLQPESPSVSLSAFWVLALGRGSRRKQQAARLLRFLMQPAQDLRLLPHGAVPVRLSTWRDPAVQAQYPPYAHLESLSLGARTLPQSVQLPRLAALADHLTQQAITTQIPIPFILQKAQRDFADLSL